MPMKQMLVENIFGTFDTRFERVQRTFRKNFVDKWEREGAEIAIFYKGQLVVDLQGGYKDASALVKWTNSTRTVIFSVTKAVASLCIWVLIDQGRLRYEQRVVEFWPEFGKNGKDKITVEHILTHKAGLPIFDQQITLEIVRDPEQIAKIIEAQSPIWTDNRKSGYHAITFGWLLDQIVRRVDKKKRSLAEFARDEIFKPHDIDFHIGLPASEEHTVSRISCPSAFEKLREIRSDPRILVAQGLLRIAGSYSVLKQARLVADWIQIDKKRITFNNPEIHAIEQCAALGITKAKELAKLFALMLDGKLISKELLERFNQPQFSQIDTAVKVPIAKGFGYFYEKHPLKPNKWLYGHPGYGGSSILVDAEDQLVIAYVTNGLKFGGGLLTRTFNKLKMAALKSVQELQD